METSSISRPSSGSCASACPCSEAARSQRKTWKFERNQGVIIPKGHSWIYTSIDPKQQQSILQRNSCEIKSRWLVAPEKRKIRKEGRQALEPQLEPGGTSRSWWNRAPFRQTKGDQRQHSGTGRNREIMMEQNPFLRNKRKEGRQAPELEALSWEKKGKVGRQAPEPKPEPEGTGKS